MGDVENTAGVEGETCFARTMTVTENDR